jgi:RND family efflux transporter MFP subunit
MRAALTVFFLVPALALLTACAQHAEADPRNAAPRVRIAVAMPADTGQRTFTGVVVARVQSDLGFRVAGKITERLVDVGQHITRGQPLMRLDPSDLTLGVAAQTGAVESALARSIRADADLARLGGLVEQGAMSAQERDQLVAEARSAKAQLAVARAQADLARNADRYGLLVAGVDGIVVATQAEPGQVVAAGQTVIELASDGPREAAVNLPETLRPTLGSLGQTTLYGEANASSAVLRELSGAADPLTRTFAARYVLQGRDAQAPLGATVTVRLSTSSSANGIVVPLGALCDRGQGPGVWVIVGSEKKSVAWHPVTIAQLGQENATLSAGLKAGERVVALGTHLLHEGLEVQIADERTAAR